MDDLKRLLLQEKQKLQEVLRNAEEEWKRMPEGGLTIAKKKGHTEYYHNSKSAGNAKNSLHYIKKNELQLARDLAQKDYDRKILQSVMPRLQAIERLLKNYDNTDIKQIYDALSEDRKRLITPAFIPDDKYIEQWQAFEYINKPLNPDIPEIYTEKGERVRSKSEKILADKFNKEGIPYRYECPLYLKGIGWVHPDFTLLNIKNRNELYWEHCGRMDDPEYCEQALSRINQYIKNGFLPGQKLILSFETKNHPLNMKVVEKNIEFYLKN